MGSSLLLSSSGTASNVRIYCNSIKLTERSSTKIFKVATGHKTKPTEVATMEHKLQEPARTFNMIPGVVLNSLVSTSKFCDARYFTILN